MNVLANVFLIIGILCILYYGAIILYAGMGAAFLWFWITAGIINFILAGLLYLAHRHKIVLPVAVIRSFLGILILGIIVSAGIFINIAGQGNRKPEKNADYVIILGAQVRGTRLSRALKNRLDTAYTYLKDNPDTLAIASGGQGTGEDISEAEAMSRYLIQKGIAQNRILLEDQSTNTNENIQFSKKIMGKADTDSLNTDTVIVTSSFHVYRAMKIAKKQGMVNVQGLGAPNNDILVVSNYIREILAVAKDWLAGNF